LADALDGMLRRMHDLHPEAMPALAAAAVAMIGGRDVQLYLSDLGQEVLLRAGGDGDAELDIDATVAGRAYRTQVPAVTDHVDGRRVWVVLLDGADRLGVLGAVFDEPGPDEIEGLQRIAGLFAELAVARAQYGDALALGRRRRPLSLASELRWAMLPPLTFAAERLTIAAVVEPAYDIAGDSFDYSMFGPVAHVGLFDAMGHGLEASRVANLVVASYRNARRTGLDIAETYRVMDAAVRSEFGESTFATGILAQLDTDSGALRVLLAGHHAPLLLREGRLIGPLEVEPTLPIGIGDPAPVVGTFSLQPDDRVLFFSDGVVEARSSQGELFGVERLADFLVRADASQEPLAETMRRLSKAILQHQSGRLDDDATLLLVEWRRLA
jgi:serine phosphatase RsbU (regulator of sigma subunit)